MHKLEIVASSLDSAIVQAYQKLSEGEGKRTFRVSFLGVEFKGGCMLTPFTYLFEVLTIREVE